MHFRSATRTYHEHRLHHGHETDDQTNVEITLDEFSMRWMLDRPDSAEKDLHAQQKILQEPHPSELEQHGDSLTSTMTELDPTI